MSEKIRAGLLYGLVAYGWWGLVPFYFRWVRTEVAPEQILCHRIIWSGLFLGLILTLKRRWGELARCLSTGTLVRPLLVSALLIAVNWLVYILSVAHDRVAQASLGYFITPLASVLLGMLVFRERLRLLQWLALALASSGVLAIGVAGGEVPWVGLVLAASFSVYGMIRKQVPVDGLIGLAAETALLTPPALALLLLGSGAATVAQPSLLARLMLSGVVTTIPLLCFGQAARLLPLSLIGFLQYISPSIQFVLAVGLFDEDLPGESWSSFVLIWAALALFTTDSARQWSQQRRGDDALVDQETALPPFVGPIPRSERSEPLG
jgi:chloramphenicol-sensitive protein RarD